MVDDRPFGGGDGMVLKPEPIFAAVEHLLGTSDRSKYPAGTKVVICRRRGGSSDRRLRSSSLTMPVIF
jgi:tRNA (guanine37-N1)-methyltransferase